MNNELSFLIYNTPNENVAINAVVKNDTIWLTQKAMAKLFECSSDNISLHLKNIFDDRELDEKAKTEYDEFNKKQQINSDFEKEIKKLLKMVAK